MKNLFLIFFIIISISGFAQKPVAVKKNSVIISTKKVYMKYKGNLNPDSLLLPVISDKYPALKAALSEESLINDEPVAENVKRYQQDGTGITSFYFEVPFENKDVLSIHLFYESMGAHPEEYQQWRTYNIRTGKLYRIENEINLQGLNLLLKQYKIQYRKQIREDQRWRAKEDTIYINDPKGERTFYDELYHSMDTLGRKAMFENYVLTPKGVVFTTERILPHMRQAYEPGRDWFVPFTKLKAYKKPGAIIIK